MYIYKHNCVCVCVCVYTFGIISSICNYMHEKIGPHENQGHIPKGKMSVQFFLKDLRESVDNQYSESKCETMSHASHI